MGCPFTLEQAPYIFLLSRIRSAEKHIFIIEKKIAVGSAVIRAMLGSAAFVEGSRGEIEFEDITTTILERVIQYLHYKARHHNSKIPIPEVWYGVCGYLIDAVVIFTPCVNPHFIFVVVAVRRPP